MGHFKEKVLEHLKIKGFSPSTVKTYINRFGSFNKAKELAELSKEMLTDKNSAYRLRRLSEIIDSDVGLP